MRLVGSIALVLAITSCGENSAELQGGAGACAAVDFLGAWEGLSDTSDSLALRADCTGKRAVCGYQFTFTPPKKDEKTGDEFIGVHVTRSMKGEPGGEGCAAAPLVETCKIVHRPYSMQLDECQTFQKLVGGIGLSSSYRQKLN